MAIKRLTLQELTEKATDIFYGYMSSSPTFYSYGETIECTSEFPTPMHMLWKETQDSIRENEERISLFMRELESNSNNETCTAILREQVELLRKERELFLKSNMQFQKELYNNTKDLGYSRNVVRIPLDKIINSYYDDLILEVLFYDNIGVNDGVYDTYKALSAKEQRINFIKENTEITHMGLLIVKNGRHLCTSGLVGKIKSKMSNTDITLLPNKFSDFTKLTLEDTSSIINNDLKQFFQSKIDLDKEDLKVLADKDVRGDNYKVLLNCYRNENMSELNEEFYIRYICPSTGRVYFNKLNIDNLKLSSYFKEGEFSTYIDSWWSINNLGASVEGDDILRC